MLISSTTRWPNKTTTTLASIRLPKIAKRMSSPTSSSTKSCTLYTPEGNFRSFPALIVREFMKTTAASASTSTDKTDDDHSSRRQVLLLNVVTDPDQIEDAADELSPLGKLPLLVVGDCENPPIEEQIFSSTAIARYLASNCHANGGSSKSDDEGTTATTTTTSSIAIGQQLLGTSSQQVNEINYWIDWSVSTLELSACLLFYPVIGYLPNTDKGVQAAADQAKTDFASALQILDDYLSNNPWNNASTKKNKNRKKKGKIVFTSLIASATEQNQVTLADIVVTSTLVYPFKLVCDPKFRKPFPNVLRWFENCIRVPQIKSVVGDIELCCRKSTNQ